LRQIAALQKAMLLLATLLLDAGVDITRSSTTSRP
jgi:hypothetical protein